MFIVGVETGRQYGCLVLHEVALDAVNLRIHAGCIRDRDSRDEPVQFMLNRPDLDDLIDHLEGDRVEAAARARPAMATLTRTTQENALMAEGTVAADQLRLFIERIERLEEEKKGTRDDIRDVYAEAKANGYDPKIMRLMVRLRKMETHTRQEQARSSATYANALGLQGVLPL
jgi:uncharacterized protein (UPF0335 family)